ncbi:MAG: RluA family pseudouridine synthase [Melioribacteraceae bacterium]|nr:RluA family pseudouridine synthase [Melioribacteraceae bacterium]
MLNYNFQIIYEDSNLIAINKPEGLASIHDKNGQEKDLQTLLQEKLKIKIFVLHRLDKEVSGIILYAKNSSTHKFISKQFENRSINKTYLALVHGIIKEKSGLINKPIKEYGSGRMGINQNGKESKTYYRLLKNYSNHTLLELNPTTGRRHQLRVHLYSIDHPIVGDLRYGEKDIQKNFPRLMLHAKSISFNLTPTKKIFLEANLPENFTTLLKSLE